MIFLIFIITYFRLLNHLYYFLWLFIIPKNLVIDTDINSAHISLEHTGEFELETPTPDGKTFLSYEWLESAYLIEEKGKLKFKFYFSEQIND